MSRARASLCMHCRGELSENAMMYEILNLDKRGSLSSRAVQLFGIGPGSFLNEVSQLVSSHVCGHAMFRCDDRAHVYACACHVLLSGVCFVFTLNLVFLSGRNCLHSAQNQAWASIH